MSYYSQNGEDFLISKVFDKAEGVFVEVGCIDGRVFSNTLHFEEKGWKGICVEAHQGFVELLRSNRPNSIVVNAAAGEVNEDSVTFYSNARGSLSSLDKNSEERWRKDFATYFHGFVEQKVAKRTLSSIFDEHKITKIDFLSLDIEGYEVPALQGLDLTRHRPHMMVIETDSPTHTEELNGMLKPNGYHLVMQKETNLFYSVDASDRDRLINHFETIDLTRAGHPVDGTSDTVIKFVIDTRVTQQQQPQLPISLGARIKAKLKRMFT